MILVTGAAGKTGRAIIQALVDNKKDVRAFLKAQGVRNLMRTPALIWFGLSEEPRSKLRGIFNG